MCVGGPQHIGGCDLNAWRDPPRRLEPQITVGLLTDATGFPLMVEAFEATRPRPRR